MLSFISGLILKVWGWKIEGDYPHEIKKKVFIAAPHTSYTDFFLGVFIRSKVKFKAQWVGKKALFKFPLGIILKAMGGVPVDRSKRNSFVDSVAKVFDEVDELTILLAPEGTRKKVEKFKTGFYYIAKSAGVPILPMSLDYKNKTAKWLDLFYPGDDPESDLEILQNMFRGVIGKRPEYSFK